MIIEQIYFLENKLLFTPIRRGPDGAGQRGPIMMDITSTSEWRGSPET